MHFIASPLLSATFSSYAEKYAAVLSGGPSTCHRIRWQWLYNQAYIGRGYDIEGKLLSFNRCLFSLSRKRLHVFLGYLLDMHVHIHLLFHSFAVLPLVLCGSGQYSSSPVSYQQAPSYYPGAPWAFPDASTRPKTCHVAAANGTGDDAPNIIKAFERCGRNGKVIFDNTTCTVA